MQFIALAIVIFALTLLCREVLRVQAGFMHANREWETRPCRGHYAWVWLTLNAVIALLVLLVVR